MPDDDLTAALEKIQAEAGGSIAYAGAHECADIGTSCSAHNALRLLAALRAVLELHQPVDRGTGAQCKGCATHITLTPWPCRTYRAISREITRKGESDA